MAEEKNKKKFSLKKIIRNNQTKKAITLTALIIMVIIILTIITPKNIYQENKKCDCLGKIFNYGTKCLGIKTSCEETTTQNNTCQPISCEELKETTRNKTTSKGVDFLLIIDLSRSMEGDRLIEAKNAAKSVVEKMREQDTIGIISFSDDAQIVHPFSKNKTSLIKSIENMTVIGGTKYVPALIEAKKAFAKTNNERDKGLIFLSDGVPSDNYGEIMVAAKELWEQNIAIFTIGFGISNSSATVLKAMSELGLITGTKGFYRLHSEKESLSESFIEAYNRVSQKEELTINAYEPTSNNYQKEIPVQAQVYYNNTLLSSKKTTNGKCVKNLKITANLNGTTEKELTPTNNHYEITIKAPPGKYDLILRAEIKENNCLLTGTKTIKNITVTSNNCQINSCKEIKKIISDYETAINHETSLGEEKTTNFFLLDSSESMIPLLTKTINDLKILNKLITEKNPRTLITFSNEATITQPLTNEKEQIIRAAEKINPYGTTRLAEAFEKATALIEAKKPEGKKIVYLMTDGQPFDKDPAEIRRKAEELITRSDCLIIITYGTTILEDKNLKELFKELAEEAKQKNNCGHYLHEPTIKELFTITSEINGGNIDEKEELRIITKTPTIINNEEPIELEARLISAKTGLIINSLKDQCLPEITMTETIKKNKKIMIQKNLTETNNHYYDLLTLKPGKYELEINAKIKAIDCELTAQKKQTITVIAKTKEEKTTIIIGLIIILTIITGYLTYKTIK